MRLDEVEHNGSTNHRITGRMGIDEGLLTSRLEKSVNDNEQNRVSGFNYAPWETGVCVWIFGILTLVLVPAVYPPKLFDGLFPSNLHLTPIRPFWLYLLLCSLAALPPALITTGLQATFGRLLRGRLRVIVTMTSMLLGLALSVVWVATVYRANTGPSPLVAPVQNAESPKD